jgi:cyclohexa-1,5-dienecarbonyl-CoA hydratase
MDNSELASLSTSGDLCRITLHNPPFNFLNGQLLRKLNALIESLGDAPAYSALILDADGAAFCAGLEMSERTKEGIFLLLEQYHRVLGSLSSFPLPVIAIVRGMALGAGNELAASCDFVFATEKASFGQPEIKSGAVPSVASMILPPLIGHRKTLDLILTGKIISAQEAEGIGLIHRAVPEDQIQSNVESLLKGLRTLSRPVLALALHMGRSARCREMAEHLREAESIYLNQLMDLEDPIEGVKSFMEKRSPNWKHR